MQKDKIFTKVLEGSFLSIEEGIFVYNNSPLSELILIANEIKKKKHPTKEVGWIIDRNVNITNICISGCKFCNFYKGKSSAEAYITTISEYVEKIEEMYKLGGKQLLLQGGMHPDLGISFYENLFRELKSNFPELKLHALGPPEIVHLSKLDQCDYREVLNRLLKSGLNSLPGAGSEILSDRVRRIISPKKCTSKEWLDVMREAHKLGITTSATMMFGHIETLEERMEHLVLLRDVQSEKDNDSKGFISFIPWPFQSKDTSLIKNTEINEVSSDEYIRMIAISRIMLPNIENIQASWLTVGKNCGQLCLHAGANDFGSIMIEENVVSSAGANHKMDAEGIQKAIIEAGFNPIQRNQEYNEISKKHKI